VEHRQQRQLDTPVDQEGIGADEEGVGSLARRRRLHKYMLDIERIDHISDEMRAVVEVEWPELVHKLPPKEPQR
jgi:hypothetical protein